MRAKKMTEKQFNKAKEKIQSYFEEINNEISVAKPDINKIKNNFHEYFIDEPQDPTFNYHYQELLALEDLIKSRTMSDLDYKTKQAIDIIPNETLNINFNPNNFIFAEIKQINDQLILTDLANHEWKQGDERNIHLLLDNFLGLKEEKQAEILGFTQIKNWSAIKLLALQAAQQLKQIRNNNLNSSSNGDEDHSDSLWSTTFISALAGTVAGNLASDAFSSSFSDDSSYDSDFSSFSSSSSDISGFGGDFGGGGGTANF